MSYIKTIGVVRIYGYRETNGACFDLRDENNINVNNCYLELTSDALIISLCSGNKYDERSIKVIGVDLV